MPQQLAPTAHQEVARLGDAVRLALAAWHAQPTWENREKLDQALAARAAYAPVLPTA